VPVYATAPAPAAHQVPVGEAGVGTSPGRAAAPAEAGPQREATQVEAVSPAQEVLLPPPGQRQRPSRPTGLSGRPWSVLLPCASSSPGKPE